MALSIEQLSFTAEIVRETYDSIVSATSSLNTAQELILTGDIDLWQAERNSIDLSIKGGRDGVDLDSERLLSKIFYRTRTMLGYPFIPYSQDDPVMTLVELEVGQNFG